MLPIIALCFVDYVAVSLAVRTFLAIIEVGSLLHDTGYHWPIHVPLVCPFFKRVKQLGSSLNVTYFLAMDRQTHVAQSAALISILRAFVAPLDNTIIPSRVDKLEVWYKALFAILAYLGKPPYLNSMWFWWESTANTLAFLEAQKFPAQRIMTQTHIAAPVFKRPIHHLGLDAWEPNNKDLIPPAWEALLSFSDWLCGTYGHRLNSDIRESLEDCLLLLEAAGHACGLELCACRPFEVAAGSGSTA